MKRLAAFTISELLVYMIIAGVIFLAVMDGFLMLNRYAQRQAEKIVANTEFYSSFHRLIAIINEADSISGDEQQVKLFKDRGQYCEISASRDSSLIVKYGTITDTMFCRVTKFALLRDSLSLEVLNSTDSVLQFRFIILPRQATAIENSIKDNEIEYQYE